MKKVYGLLAVQLTITTIIGAVFMFTPGVKEFVQVKLNTGMPYPAILIITLLAE